MKMPYDDSTDQFYFDPYKQDSGNAFKTDGSDYDPKYRKPKLSDAARVLGRHIKNGKTRIQIIFTGVMYGKGKKGKYGKSLSGAAGTATFSAFQLAAQPGKTLGIKSHGGGGYSIEQKARYLLGLLEVPERITGIYIRILD